jgi:O-antigen/teichoic acid export membrane protein
MARHTALVFASTLAIQATMFMILASAALLLEATSFARLSMIVAAAMLASAFFEFGLNVTATKMYGDTRDESVLRAAFHIRLLCLPLGFMIGLGVAVTADLWDAGLGIGLGATLNLWNGVRASDQARQDYRSFVAASLAFAAIRGVAGLLTLYLTRDPVLIALASYALPILGAVFSASVRYVAGAISAPRLPPPPMLRYAAHVYLNALTFIAIPYVPQFIIASRLDPTAVGTYGLILTFTGPISLLVYSLRSVLLPKMLCTHSKLETAMWSRQGLLVIGALWAAMIAGGFLLAEGLEAFYGHKFTEIRPAFTLFFAGFCATALIGLYSLSVHTLNVPEISTATGVLKFVVLLLLLQLAGHTLTQIITLTALVMVVGEIALVLLLARRREATV